MHVDAINELIVESVGSHIDDMLNERLLNVLSTKENVNLETLVFRRKRCRDIRRSLYRLILQGSVWEHFLFINRMNGTQLMILS